MRPTVVEIIRGLQGSITGHILPELSSSYAQAQAMYSMILLEIAVTHHDTAAADLVESNRAFASLLQKTQPVLAQMASKAGCPAEVKDAATALAAADLTPRETSIKLSDLGAEWARLAGLLCLAAPLVERAATDDALAALRPLRQEYISVLRDDSQRRLVPVLGSG